MISVEGVPPKKDGANSMWRKPAERPRIARLRRAAFAKLPEAPSPGSPRELDLVVYADRNAGDLDNFLTGICDGLQAVHPNTPIDPQDWADLPPAARPDRPLFVADDAHLDRVTAERRTPDGPAHYELTLTWA